TTCSARCSWRWCSATPASPPQSRSRCAPGAPASPPRTSTACSPADLRRGLPGLTTSGPVVPDGGVDAVDVELEQRVTLLQLDAVELLLLDGARMQHRLDLGGMAAH